MWDTRLPCVASSTVVDRFANVHIAAPTITAIKGRHLRSRFHLCRESVLLLLSSCSHTKTKSQQSPVEGPCRGPFPSMVWTPCSSKSGSWCPQNPMSCAHSITSAQPPSGSPRNFPHCQERAPKKIPHSFQRKFMISSLDLYVLHLTHAPRQKLLQALRTKVFMMAMARRSFGEGSPGTFLALLHQLFNVLYNDSR